MEERRHDPRWGTGRIFGFAFGVIFIAVALTELITQDTLTPVLEYSAPLNAVHWAIGVLLLIACVAGERISWAVAGIAGVLLAGATVWFLLDRTALQDLLDYPFPSPHPLPGSYIALYGVTALAGLFAWVTPVWIRRRRRRRSRPVRAVSEAPVRS